MSYIGLFRVTDVLNRVKLVLSVSHTGSLKGHGCLIFCFQDQYCLTSGKSIVISVLN